MSDNSSASVWVYLILTLLVTITGFFKKKIEKMNVPIEEPDNEEYIETEEESEDIPISPLITESKTIETKRFYQGLAINDTEHLFQDDATENQLDNEDGCPFDGEEFDLRKAIVYKEILDRKYDN